MFRRQPLPSAAIGPRQSLGGERRRRVASAVPGRRGTIVGSQFNDILFGYGPNETFVPGAASSDQIAGASGVNTVVLSGALNQYTVTGAGNAVGVANNGNGATDTLTNIQQVKFSDYTLVFDLHSAQDTLVYQGLSQATYDRTPDLVGFRYWAGVADANNTSAISLADSFIAAPEFTAKYGASPSNTTFVTETIHQRARPRRRTRAASNIGSTRPTPDRRTTNCWSTSRRRRKTSTSSRRMFRTAIGRSEPRNGPALSRRARRAPDS